MEFGESFVRRMSQPCWVVTSTRNLFSRTLSQFFEVELLELMVSGALGNWAGRNKTVWDLWELEKAAGGTPEWHAHASQILSRTSDEDLRALFRTREIPEHISGRFLARAAF